MDSGLATKPTKPTEPKLPGDDPGVLSVESVLSGKGYPVVVPEAAPVNPDTRRELWDDWEERAAIREYDGGQPREVAEREAAREVGLSVREFDGLARK